jgi:GDP-fucose transporter C1
MYAVEVYVYVHVPNAPRIKLLWNMSNAYVASVIASYWVVSISMVYLNKILLSNKEESISAPLFVTWYQCVVTCVLCVILGHFGENTRNLKQQSFLNDFPLISFNANVAMSILPLSLIFVAMITFNNICLQYVAVSFCKFLSSR